MKFALAGELWWKSFGFLHFNLYLKPVGFLPTPDRREDFTRATRVFHAAGISHAKRISLLQFIGTINCNLKVHQTNLFAHFPDLSIKNPMAHLPSSRLMQITNRGMMGRSVSRDRIRPVGTLTAQT